MKIIKALALGTALALPVAAMAEAPRITVTGEGRVDARPDIATITLGVTTEGATAAEAMSGNSASLQTVLDRLKGAGVEDRDLQTSGLSLNPNWTQTDGAAPSISGYIASNVLTVRVRAIDSLGGVLDAAVSDGANTLNGVTFDLADPAPVMDEARKLAVADALARARLLAEAAGVSLGDILSISEGGAVELPRPMFRMDSAAAGVPVAGGEVSRNASVTVEFAIDQPE
ncbi:SIMPL domain-containing protein [Cereibacter sp. SYSU M97828]|nr:SIMPL domain-containing protein [Cereibacter flavus]